MYKIRISRCFNFEIQWEHLKLRVSKAHCLLWSARQHATVSVMKAEFGTQKQVLTRNLTSQITGCSINVVVIPHIPLIYKVWPLSWSLAGHCIETRRAP
jgi:hypothetical protein